MTLQGGKPGDVPFPHHSHQDVLRDCTLCHSLFPQVTGSIEKLKAKGKLKKMEAMKQCQACHKNKAADGQKTGPTKCNECHKK